MINENIEALAREIAVQLNQRGETVSVAESTTGGLISAALLSVPGASSYYKGGSVVYTRESRKAFLDIDKPLRGAKTPHTEMALAFAEAARDKLAATWGISELALQVQAIVPYGHPAGSSVFAVAGPVAKSQLIQTGSDQRGENMTAFTEQVLRLFLKALRK